MPAIYAHYRFGNRILSRLPADVRGQILRHRRLFDLGLQGPDFFFYYKPAADTEIGRLGHEVHLCTGRAFFTQACRDLRSDSEEGVLSYLYGLLGHYCLDSVCHSYVDEMTASGIPSHMALESEFDRYLMAMDGISSPHTHRRSGCIKSDRSDYEVISRFFPPASPAQIGESLRGMALITDLLTCGNSLHRFLARKILGLMSTQKTGLIVPPAPDIDASRYNGQFFELFEQALDRYDILLEQMRDHLSFRGPFGQEFDRIFG